MKSFDLFQKVTVDNTSRPTMIGAVISFFALSIMGYVLLKQLNEYFFIPLIQKDTTIFQDDTRVSTIPTNIGLSFPNLPCALISVDQEDLLGHHRLNIEDTLNKIPLDKKGNPNQNLFNGFETQKLRDAIIKQEGCYVEGFVPISKVQGDIHISFHAYRDVYSYVLQSGLYKNITIGHKFTLLNFGDTTISESILDKYQMRDEANNFNRVINLPNFSNATYTHDFDYFIKIIPQIFYDEYTGQTDIAYKYSLSTKTKERENHVGSMPIIMINYDYSPVAVKYTKKRRYLSHLITNICALVGGVFVIFSMLNSVLTKISEVGDDGVKTGRGSIN